VLVDCSHESRMREICTSGSMRGQRALLAGLLYSQKGFTQNSQLKTQNAGYASCKENKILVTTGITGYNALQVTWKRRSSSGLQYQAFYTYSRSMDEKSLISGGESHLEGVTTLDSLN